MHVNPYPTHVHANVIGLDPPAHRRRSSAAKCVTTINGYFWLFSLLGMAISNKSRFSPCYQASTIMPVKIYGHDFKFMDIDGAAGRFALKDATGMRPSNLRSRTNNRCTQHFPFVFNSYQRTTIQTRTSRPPLGRGLVHIGLSTLPQLHICVFGLWFWVLRRP